MDMNDSLEEDSLSWGEGEGHSIIKADFHSPICVKDVRIISITGGNVDGHVSPRITDVFDITPRPRNHSMTQPISKVYTLQKFYEVRSLLKDMGSTMIKKVKSLLFWKTSKETLTEEVPANDDVKKMNRNVTGKFAFITQQNWEKDILPYHEPLHITLRTSQLNEVGFPVDHFAVVWCYDLLSTVHDGLRVLVRKPKASMAAILDGFSVVNRSDILASIDQTGARGIPQLEAFSIREAIHEAFQSTSANDDGDDGKEVKEVETLVRWTRPLFHQQLKGSAQCLHEDGGKCSIYQRVYTEEDNGKKSYYIGPSYKVIWCDCRGEDKSLKHVEDWCEWCRCEKCSGQPLPSRFTHYDGSHNLKPPGSLTINVDLALLLLLYVIVGGTFYYGSDRLHLILYSIGAWSFIAVMRDRYEHEVTIGV
eukprot:scaffold1287_cov253-Ochromonas_danica.AAC.13